MSGLRTISSAMLGALFAAAFILADPNSKQAPGAAQSSPQGAKQYVYTLNCPGYDCFNSSQVNSMPILKAYVKWIAGNDNLKAGSSFVMDGQYAYRHIWGEQQITRFNLRTGDISSIVDLGAALSSDYANVWLEGDILFLGGCISNAQGKAQGILYAISIKEKKVKWTFTPPQVFVARLMLVIPDDRMIVSGDKLNGNVVGPSELYCLRGTNGEVLWKQPDASYAAVLCGDALICAAQKEIYARSLKDGSEIWRTPYKGFSYANEGIFSDNKRVFVVLSDDLIAFDGATGKEIWRRNGVVGHSLDGKGHILVAELLNRDKPPGSALLLDPATGETAAKLPANLMANQVLGDWAYAMDAGFTEGPPAQILGVILSFNVETGKSNILVDAREKDAPINPVRIALTRFAAIDGYLLTSSDLRSGKSGWVCLEDMRFHPDAAKMVLGIKPDALDEKMKANIAELIGKLGSENPDVKKAATEELQSLLDIAEEHLESAAKDNSKPNVKEAAEKILKRLNDLRKYLDELGCNKDPIYFTALIRHTADLTIQQKAIDRLKKITGRDFGLKPSAEWIKDQKEASDKYDDWWLKNRDRLAWSDKEDRYLTRQP